MAVTDGVAVEMGVGFESSSNEHVVNSELETYWVIKSDSVACSPL